MSTIEFERDEFLRVEALSADKAREFFGLPSETPARFFGLSHRSRPLYHLWTAPYPPPEGWLEGTEQGGGT